MQNITSSVDLKKAIKLLEEEQSAKLLLMKEQFFLTYDGIKPINLLKNTVNDILSSPLLLDNIISTGAGLATGWISKKLLVGSSGGTFRNLIGSILQYGVTSIIAKNPEMVKSVGQFLISNLIYKKNNADNQ